MKSSEYLRSRLLDVLDRRGDRLTRSQIVERFGEQAASVARDLVAEGFLDCRDRLYQRPAVHRVVRQAEEILGALGQDGPAVLPWDQVPFVFRGIEFDPDFHSITTS